MAGAGAKLFASGDVLTAAQVNTYLMDQTIMTFASTTTRDDAFGGAGEPTLAEGMFAYTTDTNTLWLYTGATDGWVNVLGSSIGQQALSNRNVIINGAMQVAQRGTSTASITAGGYFTADRWYADLNTLGTWTQSVENDAPTGSGLRKSLKMLCTTADASPAAGDYLLVNQALEGQNIQQFAKGTASARPITVSFWVKSNVTGTYIANLYDQDNTRSVSASYTISASATWEKKTITFPADTTGAFDNDNGRSLVLYFGLGAGSNSTSGTLNTSWASYLQANWLVGQTNLASATNNYWQVTGVQLEAGAVATPFEFEQYSETLAKCQRYFWRSSSPAADSWVAGGVCYSTTQAYCGVYNPVPSRSNSATYTASSATAMEVLTNGAVVQTTVIAFSEPNGLTAQLIVDVASGLTAGGGATLRFRNANDYYQMSDEL